MCSFFERLTNDNHNHLAAQANKMLYNANSMTIKIIYGYGNERLTIPELERRTAWNRLHPEFRRRLLQLFIDAQDAKTDVGVGGGWRSSQEQERLFLSRYHESVIGTIRWNGKRWRKNPDVAAAAPPGRSYHEGTDEDGYGFAVDIVGDMAWANANCYKYGLVHFAQINGEPWHLQPEELPRARANYKGEKLIRWTLPNDSEDMIDMIALDYLKGSSKWIAFLWTGETLQWIVNGHADAVLTKAGVKRVDIDKDQLLGVINSSATVGNVPTGADADITKAWKARQRR
jgi:hypothetical protein